MKASGTADTTPPTSEIPTPVNPSYIEQLNQWSQSMHSASRAALRFTNRLLETGSLAPPPQQTRSPSPTIAKHLPPNGPRCIIASTSCESTNASPISLPNLTPLPISAQALNTTAALPLGQEPTTIIHNIGYCGPAVLGLQLFELISQEKITTTSHGGIYKQPLLLLTQLFSAYYGQTMTSPSSLAIKLGHYDVDAIQWIMAPILRLFLLCIYKNADVTSGDGLFEKDHFFRDQGLIEHIRAIDERCIDECMSMMHSSNQCKTATSQPLSGLAQLAERSYHLSVDDLFVLCRCLSIQLDLRLSASSDHDMLTYKNDVQKQINQRLESQKAHFQSLIDGHETSVVYYHAFIFKDFGIAGHFDCGCDDILLKRSIRWSKIGTPSVDPKQVSYFAELGHTDGPALLQQLSSSGYDCLQSAGTVILESMMSTLASNAVAQQTSEKSMHNSVLNKQALEQCTVCISPVKARSGSTSPAYSDDDELNFTQHGDLFSPDSTPPVSPNTLLNHDFTVLQDTLQKSQCCLAEPLPLDHQTMALNNTPLSRTNPAHVLMEPLLTDDAASRAGEDAHHKASAPQSDLKAAMLDHITPIDANRRP